MVRANRKLVKESRELGANLRQVVDNALKEYIEKNKRKAHKGFKT